MLNYNPVIVAMDFSDKTKLLEAAAKLSEKVGMFKIGLELFVKFGPDILNEILKRNGKIMLDLKLHDIPNTVQQAAKNAALLNVSLMTIHTSGGFAMMKAAAEAVQAVAEETGNPKTKILGVTILTSIDEQTLNTELGCARSLKEQVVTLAKLAQKAGLDGVVCSPHEITEIREACGKDFLIVTPGIRPAGSAVNDQKRIMTPSEAIKKGANYMVIGRPITHAESPELAAAEILTEIKDL